MGLFTDYYAQTRTNILSQDPLPSLDRAYQLVVQNERVRQAKQMPTEQPPEAVGFTLRTALGKGKQAGGSKAKPDRSRLHCTHCKKTGHLVFDCFEFKGYPEWWPNPSKRGKPQSSKGRARARQMLQQPVFLVPAMWIPRVIHLKHSLRINGEQLPIFLVSQKFPMIV